MDCFQCCFCKLRNKFGSLLISWGKAIKCKHVIPPPTPGTAKRIIFNVEYLDTHKIEKGILNMILTDIQKVSLSIQVVDAVGNPAAVEGAPVWTSSDPTVLTVTAAADGMSADAVAVGPLGTAQVSVVADADLGTGVTNIAGTLDVQVVASQAVGLTIATATPVNK
jgi:hypothetical protein